MLLYFVLRKKFSPAEIIQRAEPKDPLSTHVFGRASPKYDNEKQGYILNSQIVGFGALLEYAH